MKNPNTNKLQPSLSTQPCTLKLIIPQATYYNKLVISDTKKLTTNTANIPHWVKIAQHQIDCFGMGLSLPGLLYQGRGVA